MQIVIIAGGSRGDVQPYVALGQGLLAAGHAVRLVATEDFRALGTAYGLEFAALGGGIQAQAQSQMQAIAERGNLLEILSATGRGAEQLAHQSATAGLAASHDADVLLAGLGSQFVGLALAQKLGRPLIQAHLMPFTPTRAFPSVLTPLPASPLTRWANAPSHHLTQQMFWQMFRGADATVRTQVLHLQRSSFWGPFAALQQHTRLTLYGYSPHVIPPPPDWPAATHVTGYWFLDPPPGWEPPPDLVAFLQAGPPPVYVGFGSMPSRNPAAAAELVLQALARAGQRGVLSAGWGGLTPANLPPTVHLVGSVPHSWLFPRMAAVVHHGGAGTTGAGLAAGVPSIVVPFFGDQPFWGSRVAALGVGPQPIPRARLTLARLAGAITQAVTDPVMRQKAADLGQRIRAEDGIGLAVAAINQAFAKS